MSELRRYGAWAGNPKGTIEDTKRCIESVYGGRSMRFYQCNRPRGHGKDGLYCKQHDPEVVAAKEKARHDKYKAKSDAISERYIIQRIEHESHEPLLSALKCILDIYVKLANSGDAGNWDAEKEAEVIAARAAISKAEGK